MSKDATSLTASKKSNVSDRLLGRTKFCWNDGHMELPCKLMHASEAALTMVAARTKGAATAAARAKDDERIVSRVAYR